MSAKTDDLRDLYVDLTGQESVTERQEEVPSHDPVEATERAVEADLHRAVTEDGLDDAVEGIEADL